VGKFLAEILDNRSLEIKSELDAARKLREEAEEILAIYKQKQAEFSKEAENILAKAREDAKENSAHAQAELQAALNARKKNALEKIAQEESAAIADVRNRIVDITLDAVHNILAEQLASTPQDELVKLVISDIERKIH
jgi:F-type H+-transporting ATPase subunit b